MIPIGTNTQFYAFTLVVLALSLWWCTRPAGEPHGPCAHRRARQRTRQRGVRDPTRGPRSMLAFAISGFIAGVAGALFVLQQQLLVSQTFTPDASLRVFAMVVVGGLGSISARSSARCSYTACSTSCRRSRRSSPPARACSSCCCSCPAVSARRSATRATALLRWYARRKGIRVPSLLADTRVPESHDRRRDEVLGEPPSRRCRADGRRVSRDCTNDRRRRAAAARCWFTHPGLPLPRAAHAAPVLRRDERRRGAVPADRPGRPRRA